jgi:acetyl esterase/lipase
LTLDQRSFYVADAASSQHKGFEEIMKTLTRKTVSACLAVLGLLALACQLSGITGSEPEALQAGQVVFSGRALLDSNDNGVVDDGDRPLPGARLLVGGVESVTDAQGVALVVLPEGAEWPVSGEMLPPEDGFEPVSPNEAIFENGKLNHVDFLFAERPAPPSETAIPGRARAGAEEFDLTYCSTAEGVALKMDIYYPQALDQPAPVVVYIHGGSWTNGDKAEGAGLRFLPALRYNGFVVIAINYRLAPEYPFPAHIQDAKCAIRHLRAFAGRYGIDPRRIGVMGSSAGGHLAALLGLADKSAGWDDGQYASFSSRVRAVVDLFGPSDLTQFSGERERAAAVFGVSPSGEVELARYSPVNYVSAGDPPFLILHGLKDQVVPPEQSQLLYEALRQAGVPAQLLLVENAGHGFEDQGGDIQPALDDLIQAVIDFYRKYL